MGCLGCRSAAYTYSFYCYYLSNTIVWAVVAHTPNDSRGTHYPLADVAGGISHF